MSDDPYYALIAVNDGEITWESFGSKHWHPVDPRDRRARRYQLQRWDGELDTFNPRNGIFYYVEIEKE